MLSFIFWTSNNSNLIKFQNEKHLAFLFSIFLHHTYDDLWDVTCVWRFLLWRCDSVTFSFMFYKIVWRHSCCCCSLPCSRDWSDPGWKGLQRPCPVSCSSIQRTDSTDSFKKCNPTTVCHGIRLARRNDYFWVTFNHFWSKLHFFETAGAVAIGSSLKSNHHNKVNQVNLV